MSRKTILIILVLAIALSLVWGPMTANARVRTVAEPPPGKNESGGILFVENLGQFPGEARFWVMGGERPMWLAEDAIWFTVLENRKWVGNPESADVAQEINASRRGVHVRLSFKDANPHPGIEPFDRLDTHVSFFRGNDPAAWRPGVPVWRGVRYVDLFPGVDLELSGKGGELSWRLIHRAAVNIFNMPEVRLDVEGVESVRLENNFFHLDTVVGELSLPLLSADQSISAGRLPVLDLNPEVAEIQAPFALGTTEQKTRVEKIETGFLFYSTFLGGNGGEGTDDEGRGIAVDRKGAVYVAGYTQSIGFPVTPGAFDTTGVFADAFVAKLNPSGSRLVYATYLGGESFSQGNDIAVDESGVAYITGRTTSADFPTTPGAFDRIFNPSGYDEGYVVKLNSTGTNLIYATLLGGNSSEWPEAIALDPLGKVYVTGLTDSFDFPTTAGSFDSTCGSDGICNADPYARADAFVSKFNENGSALEYSTYLGGQAEDVGYGIAIDQAGAAYLTGYSTSPDFPATSGSFDPNCGIDGNCDAIGYARSDAFVAKLSPGGSTLDYSTFFGGSADDAGKNIAVDEAENAYVTGYTWSFDFPVTLSAFDGTHGGATDAFVAKINQEGSHLIYSTLIGGNSMECYEDCDIAVNASGEAFLTGSSASADFPTTSGAFDRDCSDGDVYVVKLDQAGSGLPYSSCVGGSSDWEGGKAIALDRHGSVYLTGWTSSTDFPTTRGAFDRSYNGEEEDIFILKMRIK